MYVCIYIEILMSCFNRNITHTCFFKGKEGVWNLMENLWLVTAYGYCIMRNFQLTIRRTQYSTFLLYFLHI